MGIGVEPLTGITVFHILDSNSNLQNILFNLVKEKQLAYFK